MYADKDEIYGPPIGNAMSVLANESNSDLKKSYYARINQEGSTAIIG